MEYLLWDFDCTLAYRKGGAWADAIKSAAYKYNIELKNSDIQPFLFEKFPWHNPEKSHEELMKGMSWWEYMNSVFMMIFNQLKVVEKYHHKLAKQVKIDYLDIDKWKLYADTVKALECLTSKGFKHIILSNHVPELDLLINKLGIGQFFDRIISSADIGYEKPNKMIFEIALNELRDSQLTIMIGDSYKSDILGAKNIGLPAILVRKENKYNFEYYCKSLENIEGLLKNWER